MKLINHARKGKERDMVKKSVDVCQNQDSLDLLKNKSLNFFVGRCLRTSHIRQIVENSCKTPEKWVIGINYVFSEC